MSSWTDGRCKPKSEKGRNPILIVKNSRHALALHTAGAGQSSLLTASTLSHHYPTCPTYPSPSLPPTYPHTTPRTPTITYLALLLTTWINTYLPPACCCLPTGWTATTPGRLRVTRPFQTSLLFDLPPASHHLTTFLCFCAFCGFWALAAGQDGGGGGRWPGWGSSPPHALCCCQAFPCLIPSFPMSCCLV